MHMYSAGEGVERCVETGSVKWFCDKKGYGFLKCSNFNGDVFAHHSEIVEQGGFKNLRKGQHVSFVLYVENTQKKAKQIRVLN